MSMERRSLSTYLREDDLDAIILLIGNEIRSFYEYLRNPRVQSPYARPGFCRQVRASSLDDLAAMFSRCPGQLTDSFLVNLGADHRTAGQNPVRIEVRKTAGFTGAAQIAVRGIPDPYRDIALERIRRADFFEKRPLKIKKSGQMSMEVNVAGVDKALPIRHFLRHLDLILEKANYQAGERFDARLFRTWIGVDGDGTLYAKPRNDCFPTLADSPAAPEVVNYLAQGGIVLLLSGNSLERTVLRVEGALPLGLRKQFFISANGGADFGCFNQEGIFQTDPEYASQALFLLKEPRENYHDGIYLGDDISSDGNDYPAFDYVGPGRSVFVGESGKENGAGWVVGGYEAGTARLISAVGGAMSDLAGPLFSTDNIESFVRQSRRS